jgi:UrcA family protein
VRPLRRRPVFSRTCEVLFSESTDQCESIARITYNPYVHKESTLKNVSNLMNLHSSCSLLFRSTCTALGALVSSLAIANYPAFAQQVSAAPEVTEEVQVVGPGVVQREVVGRTTIGAPIEVISLARSLSYADLNLTRQSDADELRQRIGDIARKSCRQLDIMYLYAMYQPIPADQSCVKEATRKAMDMASLAIAEAKQTALNDTDIQTAKK